MPIDPFPSADLTIFLFIGLLGGAHCIGMCGPLVTMYAERMRPAATDGGTVATRADRGHLSLFEVRQHLLFNLGRTISYALIGAIMGALGALLIVSASQVIATTELIRGLTGIAIGLVIVFIGIGYLRLRGGLNWHLPGTGRVLRRLSTQVDRLSGGVGIVGLGGMHGLLPCPMLYPAYLYAFASGSPTTGALALGALGIGTIPAVFAFGTVIGSISPTGRRRLHYLLGIAFIILGYLLLAHGLVELGIHLPHPELPFWDPFDAGNHH